MIQVDSITRDERCQAIGVVISVELPDGTRASREINFYEVKISPMLGATLTVIKALNEMQKPVLSNHG